ncbi:MAG TPA: hypothetical protein VF984_03480 [Actinomycetota bacterium]
MSSEGRRPNLVSLFARSGLFWVVVPGMVFVLGPALLLRASAADLFHLNQDI